MLGSRARAWIVLALVSLLVAYSVVVVDREDRMLPSGQSLVPPPLPEPPAPYDPRHFSPETIGMPPDVGGMGLESLQTWLPSNLLVPRATAQMGPAAQEYFRNRKILRQPSPLPDTGGAYLYGSGDLYVQRQDTVGGNPYPNEAQQVELARHELLHAVGGEAEPYKSDLAAGLPALRAAMEKVGWPVPRGMESDPVHIFVAEASYVLDHPGLVPPPIESYFAKLTGR